MVAQHKKFRLQLSNLMFSLLSVSVLSITPLIRVISQILSRISTPEVGVMLKTICITS
jgi:hypothetical protein